MKYQDFKHFCTEHLITWGLHSDAVVELMAMIVAHESLGCKHRRQVGGGPALGIFQMEPPTHDSIWDHCDSIHGRAVKFGIKRELPNLEKDDVYALWMARHYLLMDKNPLPKTPEAMAQYCKDYWNRTGAATPDKYLNDWQLWKEGKL